MRYLFIYLFNNYFYSGSPTVIKDLNAIETTNRSLFIQWEILSTSSPNYTQSISIVEGNKTINTAELNDNERFYFYNISKLSLSSEYNIKLCVETSITTCSDSRNVSKLISGSNKSACTLQIIKCNCINSS